MNESKSQRELLLWQLLRTHFDTFRTHEQSGYVTIHMKSGVPEQIDCHTVDKLVRIEEKLTTTNP